VDVVFDAKRERSAIEKRNNEAVKRIYHSHLLRTFSLLYVLFSFGVSDAALPALVVVRVIMLEAVAPRGGHGGIANPC
jgi:hypothetical protein